MKTTRFQKALMMTLVTAAVCIASCVTSLPITAKAATTYNVVEPVRGYSVTSYYGEKRTYQNTNGVTITDVHDGIDFVSSNKTVYAAVDGKITNHGYNNYRGYYITQTVSGITYYYCHLTKNSFKVKNGTTVKAGTPIATMGATGNVTGVHLHFEARKSGKTLNVNPTSKKGGLFVYNQYIEPDETQKTMLKDGGLYTFRLSGHKTLCIGTKGNATASGTNVQFVSPYDTSSIWKAHYNTKTWSWYFTPKGNDNVALSIASANVKPEQNIQLSSTNLSNHSQQFRLKKSGSGYYIVSLRNSSVAVDGYGYKDQQKEGSNIWAYKYNKDVTQFRNILTSNGSVEPLPDTEQSVLLKDGARYRISLSYKPELYIGTKGNAHATKTNVQFVKKEASSTVWVAHYNRTCDAWYFTMKDNPNVALNIFADKITSGINVNVYKVLKDTTQAFKLVKTGNSYFMVSAANKNVALDAYGYKNQQKIGSNIWAYKYNKDVTQKWTISLVSVLDLLK